MTTVILFQDFNAALTKENVSGEGLCTFASIQYAFHLSQLLSRPFPSFLPQFVSCSKFSPFSPFYISFCLSLYLCQSLYISFQFCVSHSPSHWLSLAFSSISVYACGGTRSHYDVARRHCKKLLKEGFMKNNETMRDTSEGIEESNTERKSRERKGERVRESWMEEQNVLKI